MWACYRGAIKTKQKAWGLCRMESAVRNSGVDITVTEHPRLPAGPAHISAKRNLNVNAAADIATAIRPETLLQTAEHSGKDPGALRQTGQYQIRAAVQ